MQGNIEFELKGYARRLRTALTAMGINVTHADALNLAARANGKKNWEAVEAALVVKPRGGGFTTKDGVFRSPDAIESAFESCRFLELAYELGSEENGGGAAMDWDDVGIARTFAQSALTGNELVAIADQARSENGCDGSSTEQDSDDGDGQS